MNLKIETIDINNLNLDMNIIKEHPDWQIEQIANSIKEFGFLDPVGIDEDNFVIEGKGRILAAQKLGINEIPCVRLIGLDDNQKRAYIIAHNKLTMNTGFDLEALQYELNALKVEDFDLSLTGFEDFEINELFEPQKQTLAEKVKNNPLASNLFDTFIIPPFSFLDTKTGYWQERKNKWKSIGLKSEVGRGENLVFCENLNTDNSNGTSTFDPVLCEIMYTWFCPYKDSIILDPFAGGSVRGILAEKLGFNYIGIDLRSEQIEANKQNAKEIDCDIKKINWINDDSQNVDNYVKDESVDLIFTCPPYFDLEVYSDDEKDISNMNFEDFTKVYTNILSKFSKKLKNNRFAIVVISDVRDKKGFYRDLTGLTKQIFKDNSIYFYNDLILLNAVGSGALRARKLMGNRKMVRLHQNVLVFYKGNPKDIQDNFPILENVDYSFDGEENEDMY